MAAELGDDAGIAPRMTGSAEPGAQGACAAAASARGPRVLHLLPSISRQGGGVSEAARLLVAALAERMPGRIEVLANLDDDTALDLPAWPPVPIGLARFHGSPRYRFSPAMLRALVRRRDIDIVHVHAVWCFHAAAALAWQLLRGGAVVISVHGMFEPWIMSRARGVKKILRAAYLDRLVRRAGRLHVLTEMERGDVALSYPDAPVTVIPNFVEPFVPGAGPGRPAWWRPEMAGRGIYLFLGRLHEKKGVIELIAGWDALCARDGAFRDRSQLVLCGWNDGLAGLQEQLAAVAARHGNILHAGPIYGNEKARTLAAATFFVLPSKSEGLPMTVLEAWSAGAIVIMTAECNLTIGFERDAALRTGTRAAAIAASLAAADALDPAGRARLVANGRALIAERYSRDAVTDAMLKLYARLAPHPKMT